MSFFEVFLGLSVPSSTEDGGLEGDYFVYDHPRFFYDNKSVAVHEGYMGIRGFLN